MKAHSRAAPLRWTNPSVKLLAGGRDPIEAITTRARNLVISAIDQGWSGPPFDPIALAELLRIRIAPRDDIRDARTVPLGKQVLQIEYNPNRPRGRVRFSVAHEIAHTLFPDCHEQVRHRHAFSPEDGGDEWQLEMLCNIAASELVMPFGTLHTLRSKAPTVDVLADMRRAYDVSGEAIFIRAARITDHACAVFCATPKDAESVSAGYRVDYVIPSRSWAHHLGSEFIASLPQLSECTGIDFTAKGRARINDSRDVAVECMGIPPYPGSRTPRVVGVLRQLDGEEEAAHDSLMYVVGDALEPRGSGNRLVAHVVNDRTPNWGGHGFAMAVKRRYPEAQEDFQHWVSEDRARLSLGKTHTARVESETWVATMVAQKGYGATTRGPRIRYEALGTCLREVGRTARQLNASVHMPRIGCGQAGGDWNVVEEMVLVEVCNGETPVFVYDLPGSTSEPKTPPLLFE